MRAIIFANGTRNPQSLSEIQKGDVIIGVDRAAMWLIKNNIHPDLAIGDFDSVTPVQQNLIRSRSHKFKIYPEEKDFTDLELAVNYTLLLRPDEVIIYGATGKRLDHTLGNVALLGKFRKRNIPAKIIDGYNIISLADKLFTINKTSRYPYFSILPFTPKARVTIIGAKYNIENREIRQGETFGISNEISGRNCRIDILSGTIMVIQSRD